MTLTPADGLRAPRATTNSVTSISSTTVKCAAVCWTSSPRRSCGGCRGRAALLLMERGDRRGGAATALPAAGPGRRSRGGRGAAIGRRRGAAARAAAATPTSRGLDVRATDHAATGALTAMRSAPALAPRGARDREPCRRVAHAGRLSGGRGRCGRRRRAAAAGAAGVQREPPPAPVCRWKTVPHRDRRALDEALHDRAAGGRRHGGACRS